MHSKLYDRVSEITDELTNDLQPTFRIDPTDAADFVIYTTKFHAVMKLLGFSDVDVADNATIFL